eukprot:gene48312-59169_t
MRFLHVSIEETFDFRSIGRMFTSPGKCPAPKTQDLTIGSSVRMGPGYFPLVLSGLMAFFGLIVFITGLRVPGGAITSVAWRGLIIVTLSTVFFGFGMRPLGFLPTLGLTVFIAAAASSKFKLTTAL